MATGPSAGAGGGTNSRDHGFLGNISVTPLVNWDAAL